MSPNELTGLQFGLTFQPKVVDILTLPRTNFSETVSDRNHYSAALRNRVMILAR